LQDVNVIFSKVYILPIGLLYSAFLMCPGLMAILAGGSNHFHLPGGRNKKGRAVLALPQLA